MLINFKYFIKIDIYHNLYSYPVLVCRMKFKKKLVNRKAIFLKNLGIKLFFFIIYILLFLFFFSFSLLYFPIELESRKQYAKKI